MLFGCVEKHRNYYEGLGACYSCHRTKGIFHEIGPKGKGL
jgi:hypothetical protein